MDALQGAIDVDTNIFFSINRMHNMYFDYFMSAYVTILFSALT